MIALVEAGLHANARSELVRVARANALSGWAFTEWLHGRTLRPQGIGGQSWNAAAFLLAFESAWRATALFKAPKRSRAAESDLQPSRRST